MSDLPKAIFLGCARDHPAVNRLADPKNNAPLF
jgi:hypothetical protein